MAAPLLAETGGMFKQQDKLEENQCFLPLNSPQKGFSTGLLWPPLTSSLFLQLTLALLLMKGSLLSSD